MIRNDIREKHEEEYKETNKKPLSVCSGRFYVANRKEYIYCKNCSKCQKNKRYHMRIEDVPEVRFKHAESFRRCKLYEQVINDDFVKTISIFNILAVNDLACAWIYELFDYMKHKDKESQKIYGALLRRRQSYLTEVHKVVREFGDGEDFADFNNLIEDETQPIIDEIYDMVYKEFESHGIDDAEYLTKVEIARTLVSYSIHSLETRVQECRRYGIELNTMENYALKDIKKTMDNFSDWALRKVEHIDLSKERFVNVMQKLSKTLTNYRKLIDFINQTIDKDSIKQPKQQ